MNPPEHAQALQEIYQAREELVRQNEAEIVDLEQRLKQTKRKQKELLAQMTVAKENYEEASAKIVDLLDDGIDLDVDVDVDVDVDGDNNGDNNDDDDDDTHNDDPPRVPVREVPLACPSEATLARFKKASLDHLSELAGLVKLHSLRRERKGRHAVDKTTSTSTSNNNKSDHHHQNKNKNHNKNDDGLFRSAAPRDHLLLSRDYHTGEDHDHARDDHDLPAHIRNAHDAAFDASVAQRKFCQLALDVLMDDASFVEFVFVAASRHHGWGVPPPDAHDNGDGNGDGDDDEGDNEGDNDNGDDNEGLRETNKRKGKRKRNGRTTKRGKHETLL